MSFVIIKRLVVIASLVVMVQNLMSQDSLFIEQKNSLNFGIENRFIKTISFGVQRMISSKGFLTLNAAIQSQSPYDSYNNKELGLFSVQDFNKNRVFTSKSISVGYGRFLIPQVGFYVAGELRYQYRYFENKYYHNCVGSSSNSEVSLRSEYQNNYGVNAIAGYRLVIIEGMKLSFILDFNIGYYLGLSIQENYLYAEAKGTCSANNDYMQYFTNPKVENVTKFYTKPVFRIKVGINF